jgi:hypothetical protein
MFFRTETKQYNLEIVMAVTDDRHFAEITGQNWIETDVDVQPGDFYFNNKVIKLGGDGYKEIEDYIFAKREEENVVILAREAEETAERERLLRLIEEAEATGEPIVLGTTVLPPVPVPPLEERVEAVKKFPLPVFVPILSQPLPPVTMDTLNEYKAKLVDTKKMIAGIEGATDDNPNLCVFSNPIVFAEGTEFEHTVESLPIPDTELSTFLAHWKKVEADQQQFIDYLKTELNWTADETATDDGGPDPE